MSARWYPGWEEEPPLGPEEPAGDDFPGGEGSADLPDLALMSQMSGRSLRRVIERVDMETLSQALREADRSIIDRVLKNLSARTAAALRSQLESLPFAGSGDTAEARKFLLRMIAAMEKRGEISLDEPADDSMPPLDREVERRVGEFNRTESGAPEAISLMVALAERAREHGLLSLEPVLERIPEGILASGLRAIVDQMPPEEIEAVMGRRIDSYMQAFERRDEIASEGVLSLFEWLDGERTRQRLVAFLPEGEADYEELPEIKLTPSQQAANDLIAACCRLASWLHRDGIESAEERIREVHDPLLRRGLKWLIDGYHIDEAERMLKRRRGTRTDREHRRLEILLEGLLLLRDGEEPGRIQEALEGFLEEKA